MADEKSSYLVFIEKLFDTLTLSINRVDNTCKELKDNQLEVMRFIDKIHLDEVNSSIKNHDRESELNIKECTTKVTESENNISKKVDEIASKVRTMIIVVCTAFTLFTIAYFVAKNVSDPQSLELIKRQYEQQIIDHQKEIKDLYEVINDMKETLNNHVSDTNDKTE